MEFRSSNPFTLLGGKYFLNWRNHVAFGVIALIAAILFDTSRIGGRASDWLLIGLFGVAVTVVSIEIAKPILKKVKSRLSLAVSTALLIAGAIRGVSIFLFGSTLGLIPETDFVFRLFGGPIFVFFFYLTSSSIFEVYLNFKQQSSLLQEEKNRLEQAKETYVHDLVAFNEQQRARVRELLSPSIWELQKKLEVAGDRPSVETALLQMQAINNEVVRPLSHSLISPQFAEKRAPNNQPTGAKIAWPPAVSLGDNIPVGFFILIASSIGFSSQVATNGFFQGVALTAIGVATATLVLIFERALLKELYLPIWVAIPISSATGFLSGLLGVFLATMLGLTIDPIFYLLAGIYFAIAKAMSISYALFKRAWSNSLDEIRNVTDELKVVNSWLRQQIWLGQKSLAMELHGSVQSTLHAMAARLSRMKEINRDELQEIVAAIRDSLASIENEEYLDGEDFVSLLQDLKELWEGTTSISWNISPEAQAELNQNLGLARCLFEVAREAVINAVKHGEATEIKLEISRSDQMLELAISNNGKLAKTAGGSGQKLFNQVCHSHSLRQDPSMVVFSAELALSL